MKWLLIAALWSTHNPQNSFRFYTEAFTSQQDCEIAIQALNLASAKSKVHVQAICKSKDELGFTPLYY